MYDSEAIVRKHCSFHLGMEECGGALTTRRSIWGAVVTLCRRTWEEPYDVEGRKMQVDLGAWPEVIA